MIRLREALAIMQQTDARGRAKPFHVVFVTADTNRNKGGEVIEIEKAILSRMKYSQGKTTAIFTDKKTKPGTIIRTGRRRYSTVNICPIGSSEITKINIDLILEINGIPVA